MMGYNIYANCYIVKPVDLDQFFKSGYTISEFWLNIVSLPHIAPTTKNDGNRHYSSTANRR